MAPGNVPNVPNVSNVLNVPKPNVPEINVRPSVPHASTLPVESSRVRKSLHHLTDPGYHSPHRHHKRQHSQHREVPETLNARSEYNDSDGRRINQYVINEEIGRGSFGAVYIATDQEGIEYAVKEFSKTRLRRHAQSHMLRRTRPMRPGALGLEKTSSPRRQRTPSEVHLESSNADALYLIREEIAVMKKLNHQNLVQLIEVLDDPEEDSLFMVLEMCKKGVVMKVDLKSHAEPYDEEICRCFFRDMILGVEYLHAQGVVHRDLKPDNLLLTADNTLKISDFGVSEIFEAQQPMRSAKSTGSPAFMSPEMCVTNHGTISGPAVDIWAMGVCLYCLLYGYLPFENSSIVELMDSIKTSALKIPDGTSPHLKELLSRVLEKDPEKRIKMEELRAHAWVTLDGVDSLLSTQDNTAELVEPPTEDEMKSAITRSISQIVAIMKAVRHFKSLLARRLEFADDFLTRSPQSLSPTETDDPLHGSLSMLDASKLDRASLRGYKDSIIHAITSGSRDPEIDLKGFVKTLPHELRAVFHDSIPHHAEESIAQDEAVKKAPLDASSLPRNDSRAGHARPPTEEAPIMLNIGAGMPQDHGPQTAISAPPQAVDDDMYQSAYDKAVSRIREERGAATRVFKTKRVFGEGGERDGGLANVVEKMRAAAAVSGGSEPQTEATSDPESTVSTTATTATTTTPTTSEPADAGKRGRLLGMMKDMVNKRKQQ